MILCHRHRYVFIHIPKTGGTAVAAALEQSVGANDILVGDTSKARKRRRRVKDRPGFARIGKHAMLAEIEAAAGRDIIANYRVVTIVRNPWERALSFYHWARVQSFADPMIEAARSMSFQTFIRNPVVARAFRANPYSLYITDRDQNLRSDVVLRHETLGRDMSAFADMIGASLPPLPRINASDRPENWRDAYGPDDVACVAAFVAQDAAQYGYRFEPA